MFKSKLQELCQQQKRAMPKYTFIKDGDDHCPQFKASVVVGGVAFHTPCAANSSKQALNQVAQLAFLHFISEASDQKCENTEKVSSKKEVQNKEELTYKSKLQELCQKQKWALPRYTCIRDGADHCPQFKASVVVCGVIFDSPAPCNSSKQALNEVAQLAFLHFTSNQRSENAGKKIIGKEGDNSKFTEDDKSVNNYLEDGMKNKLRKYAQRKNLDQPAYCTEKEGDCFKAKVRVGEDWFTRNELCATAEEAENSAAATALLALLTDEFQEENDPQSYKTLLHKTARDEGFFPPVYKTMRCVESDSRSFSTTVEVEGEVFQGAASNSEKLSELNAAKAAYTALIERKLFEPRYGVFKLARRFDLCGISDTQESHTYGSPSPLISDTIGANQEMVDQSKCKSEAILPAEMKSYLLCSRVKVYTCMPNMALPKGTVVLPISGDKWAVVTLEFPNEKAVV